MHKLISEFKDAQQYKPIAKCGNKVYKPLIII